MNNIIKETNNLMKVQEKVEVVFEEIDNQVRTYNSLEKENNTLKKEINNLEKKNKELKEENNILKDFIYDLLDKLKHFFRKILLIGDNKSKDLTSNQVKEIYDSNQYDDKDIYQISKGTTKQDELFEYANIPNYMKGKNKNRNFKNNDYEKNL